MSRARRRPTDYDDFDDDYSIRKSSRGGRSALTLLILAAIGLLLLTCLIGTVIGIIVWQMNTTPARLPGTWKGSTNLGGLQRTIVYTFEKDGSFRQDTFDPQGGQMGPPHRGRWQFRDGEVDISWDVGAFERAQVTWIDDDTIDYHITGHTQAMQIGSKTRFKRQANAP